MVSNLHTVRNKAKILSHIPLKEAIVILEINIAKFGAVCLTPKTMNVNSTDRPCRLRVSRSEKFCLFSSDLDSFHWYL